MTVVGTARRSERRSRGEEWRSSTARRARDAAPRLSQNNQMRFEVTSAFVIGILLPGLETLRRGAGAWAVDFTTMFEDYVAGALLLTGAWAVARKRYWGPHFLLVAWSYVTGMMSSSVWYQLEETIRATVSEPHVVLVIKLLLWGTCVSALVSSFRCLVPGRRT